MRKKIKKTTPKKALLLLSILYKNWMNSECVEPKIAFEMATLFVQLNTMIINNK